MRYLLFFCLLVSSFFAAYGQPSRLSDGRLFKLRISESGVYKVSSQQLREAGLSVSEPERLQILGFGNGMLPQPNSAARPTDIPEVPTQLVERPDGSFELWFYAQGADRLSFDLTNERVIHEKNLYDDHSYYFLKVSENQTGKRIQPTPLSTTSGTPLSTFNDFYYYENDQYNLLASIRLAPGGSGRLWLGEIFDFDLTYDYPFDLSGQVAGTPIEITSRVMAYAFDETFYEVLADGTLLGTQEIVSSIDSRYAQKGYASTRTFTHSEPADADFTLRLRYQKGNAAAIGFLDFLRVNFMRELRLYGDQTAFRSFASRDNPQTTFNFANPSGQPLAIWEVTDPQETTAVPLPDPAASQLSFTLGTAGVLREFIAFREDRVPTAEWVGEIENQDLKALPVPDLLIVSPTAFLEQAERLANLRRQADGLEVMVAELPQIYHEFSSGRQDITAIRDFIRHLYLKDPEKLRYVLLFGDASYDPKNRTAGNTNWIPIYQSRDSFHPIYSYSSDDYFGFMEENEGQWAENNTGNHTLDLGVGRLPVQNMQQAIEVVDKLERYARRETLGSWRKKLVFVSDDGDRNIHQEDSERLTDIVEENHPEYQVERLYVDAFEQVPDANDQKRSPEAREALNEKVNGGAFIVNFMGHGSEVGWTSENILDMSTIQRWRNPDQMPLFVTATCEFGRYDNPLRESGGERILLNPIGGGIALITTTRPVFSNTNFLAAAAFYRQVFQDTDQRLGDIMRATKNNSLTLVNRNFALLGDPSMKLAYPQHEVRLNNFPEKLEALQTVELEGEILNPAGTRNTGFTGTAEITVFDTPTPIRTLGEESDPAAYPEYKNVLFRGEASVENGLFTTRFVVPKDAQTRQGEGKISVYAYTEEEDASGAVRIEVGGLDSQAPADDTPPVLQVFLENTDFQQGDAVPQNTLLLVEASDESGFNPSATDRQMLAILDQDPAQTWVLNDYFQTQKDDFTQGFITFPLQNLELGEHQLTVRLWDAHNNMAEVTVRFVVVAQAFALEGGQAYPNPVRAREDVRFDFTHNRPGADLEVTLDIFDRIGRSVFQQKEVVLNAPEDIDLLRWNAPPTHVQAQGLYLYRIQVRSDQGETTQQVGKIISLR